MYTTRQFYKKLSELLEQRRAEKIHSIEYLHKLRDLKSDAEYEYGINGTITHAQLVAICEKADELTHAEHRHCGDWY